MTAPFFFVMLPRMLIHPDMDPVAFHLGSLAVYWYGVMYLVGFFLCWGMLLLRLRESPWGITKQQLSDLLFYALIGLVVGGRMVTCCFMIFPD